MASKSSRETTAFATRAKLKALSKKQFLKSRVLTIEQWGMSVGVRQLSVAEKMHKLPQSPEEGEDLGIEGVVAILSICLVDEDGEQLFDDGDTDFLMQQSDEVLQQLLTAALEINGMNSEALENIRKNSSEGQSESSVSA